MVVFEAWSFNTTHRLCQHNTQTIWKSIGSSLVAKLCHWKKPWPKGHDNCHVCSMATLVCFTNLHFCFWYFYSVNFDFLSVEWLINCKNKLFWMSERQFVLLVIDLDFEDSDICFPLLLYHINPSARKLFFFFFSSWSLQQKSYLVHWNVSVYMSSYGCLQVSSFHHSGDKRSLESFGC